MLAKLHRAGELTAISIGRLDSAVNDGSGRRRRSIGPNPAEASKTPGVENAEQKHRACGVPVDWKARIKRTNNRVRTTCAPAAGVVGTTVRPGIFRGQRLSRRAPPIAPHYHPVLAAPNWAPYSPSGYTHKIAGNFKLYKLTFSECGPSRTCARRRGCRIS
jgi:hypothetical protein